MTLADRAAFLALFDALGPDEQRIIGEQVRRMTIGRQVYGEWRPASDRRNLPGEALAEVMDALNYCAGELVRLADREELP